MIRHLVPLAAVGAALGFASAALAADAPLPVFVCGYRRSRTVIPI